MILNLHPPIKPEWKGVSKTGGHPFRPLGSYMALFPPRIPHYSIQPFTRPGDLVLDPFSGRGTTVDQTLALCKGDRPVINHPTVSR